MNTLIYNRHLLPKISLIIYMMLRKMLDIGVRTMNGVYSLS